MTKARRAPPHHLESCVLLELRVGEQEAEEEEKEERQREDAELHGRAEAPVMD